MPVGNVRDAHGRVGSVHVLSTLATRAIRVDANVFRLDIDVDALVDFRRNKHAGKRRMPALGLIEGRDAHQAMHADLAGQQAIGVFSIDAEGRRLDAGFFARLIFVHRRLEALALGPSKIHAHQHLGPVLRLGAARAGMDGHDGVTVVVVAGEQGLGFQLVDQRAQCIDLAPQVGGDVFAFMRQVEVGGDVAGAARQLVVRRQRALKTLLLAHHLL